MLVDMETNHVPRNLHHIGADGARLDVTTTSSPECPQTPGLLDKNTSIERSILNGGEDLKEVLVLEALHHGHRELLSHCPPPLRIVPVLGSLGIQTVDLVPQSLTLVSRTTVSIYHGRIH